jgi:hypothetical protein
MTKLDYQRWAEGIGESSRVAAIARDRGSRWGIFAFSKDRS